jgi:hypothetical protein
MTRAVSCVLAASIVAGSAAAAFSASSQEGTAYPGQPTQGRVWVENRSARDAVSVAIEGVTAPLPVQLTGTSSVTLGGNSAVNARLSQQQWEYRDLQVASTASVSEALNAAGQDGWETTGLAFPSGKGALIVLKRPRVK